MKFSRRPTSPHLEFGVRSLPHAEVNVRVLARECYLTRQPLNTVAAGVPLSGKVRFRFLPASDDIHNGRAGLICIFVAVKHGVESTEFSRS